MADFYKRLLRGIATLWLLKRSLPMIALWPIVALILGTIIWNVTLSKIDEEKIAVEKKALQDASSLSHAYAQYVVRAIEQADQITLRVKYDWEHSHGKLDLKELSQNGMFRSSRTAGVIVIDRKGMPVTASLPGVRHENLADREYFIFHSSDDADVLLIGKPVLGRSLGKTVIQFTRRLETADGSFDGVVLVGVEPDYFTSFYAGSNPGETGLLAVLGKDGTLRSARIGGAVQDPSRPPLLALPLFDSLQGAGLLEGAQWFGDHQSRYVAWESLGSYPLVTMAGLSKEQILAPHREVWATYRQMTIAACVLLFLFALVATGLAARLAWKKQQEEAVRKAYRIATEGGNEGFYMWQAVHDRKNSLVDFQVVDCNERGAAFYGVKKDELLGARLSALYAGSYFDVLINTFRSAMESGFYEDEEKLPHDSPIKMDWVKRRLVRSGTGLAVTVQDISAHKLAVERIEFLAHHDPLTGLPNRLLLRDRFDQAMAVASREETGTALLFLDLDNFKQVNDNFGHQVGDRLLIEVVRRLQTCIRDTDTISRQGGDEFILILSNIGDINAISRLAQNILDAVSQPVEIEQHIFSTSASIGISLFPDDGGDFDELLKHADTAMYQVKESGRNGYQFFTAEMNAAAQENLQLQTQLRNALQKQELLLHYQPQLDLGSGKVIGMEALIRWQHPELGLVPPARFIPLAEESGLIIPIGDWVLEEACRQARIWQDSGLPPFIVAVNLSALQFKRGKIVETVEQALERSGLPSGMLELELTESILLQDMESALKTIRDLKALGVKLSIDDFGTGYSSLSYLKRLKVDKLKIDQSFVRDIVEDSDDLAIVCAIIQLGQILQLRVIAEGVETAEQLQSLKISGCDEVQGYYFCRPLAAERMTDWLTARNAFGVGNEVS